MEVMEINLQNLQLEYNDVVGEKKKLSQLLNQQRALNNSKKEDYLYAKDDVQSTETMLIDAREEVHVQKNIVRSFALFIFSFFHFLLQIPWTVFIYCDFHSQYFQLFNLYRCGRRIDGCPKLKMHCW